MSYATDHASALADIRAAGQAVAFTRVVAGSTYDPETDSFTGGDSEAEVGGFAVAVPGDPERYRALGLVLFRSVTLLFVPTSYGDVVEPGYSVAWGGVTYTVRDAEPIAPDGSAILQTVVCER